MGVPAPQGLGAGASTGAKGAAQRGGCRTAEAAILAGPQAAGFTGELWTVPRVRQMIIQRFGVRFSAVHVRRLLGRLGFSPQRPVGRARERDEAKIADWKTKTWPRLMKSTVGGPPDRLPRRKRAEPAPAPGMHLGGARTNPGSDVQLLVEEALGDCRSDLAQLLLPAAPWIDQEPASNRVPPNPAASTPWKVSPVVGWRPHSSQQARHGLSRRPSRLAPHRAASRLRPGTQSRRVSLELQETTRTGQLLSQGHLGTQPRRQSRTQMHPPSSPPAQADLRLLRPS